MILMQSANWALRPGSYNRPYPPSQRQGRSPRPRWGYPRSLWSPLQDFQLEEGLCFRFFSCIVADPPK
jgi:hypothetical protein